MIWALEAAASVFVGSLMIGAVGFVVLLIAELIMDRR